MKDKFINMTDIEHIDVPSDLEASLEKMLDGMAAAEKIMAEEKFAGVMADGSEEKLADRSWPIRSTRHEKHTQPERPEKRTKFRILLSGLSAAAAVAIISLTGYGLWLGSAPADTFDNPQLAYLEVEKALNTISGHLQNSSSEMEKTEKMIDRQREKLQHINYSNNKQIR